MPQCPQCNKPLRELVRRCPSCQADLDLLVDFVSHLQGGVERARELTRAGELGQAVWAYLEVLEVDPDNNDAKKQIAQVATAVRQFDVAAPGRAWLKESPDGATAKKPRLGNWRTLVLALLICAAVAFIIGFMLGGLVPVGSDEADPTKEPPKLMKDNHTLSG